MRKTDESRPPYVMNIFMSHNSSDFINQVVQNLKKFGIQQEKSFEKKRKITESEVTGQALAQTNLETVLSTILEYEKKFAEEKKASDGQHLIELYNKIIEFYTGIRNDFESA